MKLSRIGSVTTVSAERLSAIAVENPHLVIGSVSHVHVFLLRIARKGKLIGRSARRKLLMIQAAANLAARRRVRRHVEFPDELPLLREDFNPILSTLAYVDQPLLCKKLLHLHYIISKYTIYL